MFNFSHASVSVGLVTFGLCVHPAAGRQALVAAIEGHRAAVRAVKAVKVHESAEGTAATAAATVAASGQTHPVDIFGSFHEGESTYDADADNGRNPGNSGTRSFYAEGWEPNIWNKYEDTVVDPAWFHESVSGGSQAAWQTYYPAVDEGLAGNTVGPSEWTQSSAGTFKQEYRTSADASSPIQTNGNWADVIIGSKEIPAGWFDASVEQYDGFGRRKLPSFASPRRWTGWMERSVNTTLSCSQPGCSASVSLQAWNGTVERARNCRLSVVVKPTDFDEQYSGEQVDYIMVNGVNVSVGCAPRASGCNATAQQPYYPCVTEFSLDKVVPINGVINISAKIPLSVDECPYNGNYLYAIPMVTCLVAPHVPGPIAMANDPGTTFTNVLFNASGAGNLSVQVPLKCQNAGCIATSTVNLATSVPPGYQLNQCTMQVDLNATDFDNSDWSTPQELIEFIQVEGQDVLTNYNPGHNPCKATYQGNATAQNLTQNVVILSNHNVSNLTSTGVFMIQGKVSPAVDECASQGNMLDAMVQVNCSLTALTR